MSTENVKRKNILFWQRILRNALTNKTLDIMYEYLNKKSIEDKINEGYYLGLAIRKETNKQFMNLDDCLAEHIVFVLGYYLGLVKPKNEDDSRNILLSIQNSHIETLLQYIDWNLIRTKSIYLLDLLSVIFKRRVIPFIETKDSEIYRDIKDPFKELGYIRNLYLLLPTRLC